MGRNKAICDRLKRLLGPPQHLEFVVAFTLFPLNREKTLATLLLPENVGVKAEGNQTWFRVWPHIPRTYSPLQSVYAHTGFSRTCYHSQIGRSE